MNVLGLDLSLTSTGYCHGGEAGCIVTDLRGSERLRKIGREIENIIVEKQIDIVAIEGYSFASKNSQAHSIGELGGVVKVFLLNLEKPFILIPPTCRAKFATGKGNAGKAEVISSISAITGIVWKGASADDMCDAWVLEEMVLTKLEKGKHIWPKESLLSLDKVDWTSASLYEDYALAEGLVKAKREKLLSLRTSIDALRTLNANVRVQVQH